MGKKCVGVDVGGTTVKIGIFELDGSLIKKWEVPTRKEEDGKYILPDVAASLKAVLREEKIVWEEVAGVGMGLPGPVLPDGYVEVCVNLGWREMNPQEILSSLLDGVLVRSANDANAAALGEMWQGGGKGFRDIVMVTLGTGVGGGVIIDQRIIAGRHGLGGEFGHMRIREGEHEQCNCKGYGCVEQIASATGIAREAKRLLAAGAEESSMRRFGERITAKNVVDCAKEGDAMALKVMETVGYYLGWALANVSVTVDPEVFVIGGGVSKAGVFLTDFIKKYYEEFTPISKNKAGIALAKLGNDAGIYGAARLIID